MSSKLASEGYDICRRYVNKRDGELYWLKIITGVDANGQECKVFHLKNQIHFWSGNEAEFKAAFEQ